MSPSITYRTFADVHEQRARLQPDLAAYTFLADGESEASILTYRELDEKARAIAAALVRRADAGERAILLYPPGLEFVAAFFGCLYAGVVPAPAYPPDPMRLQISVRRL